MISNMFRIFILLLLLVYVNHSIGQCNTSRNPIVFVHGFLGSGDTWATQIQRFSGNGYCENRLFVFDWNSLDRGGKADSLLSLFIDKVLLSTGSSKIDLVGHSAGGGLCSTYLNNPVNEKKVAHYAHMASFPMARPAGKNDSIPTLQLYSNGDWVIKEKKPIPGGTNIMQEGMDHLQVATHPESFKALFAFFTGHAPETTDILPGENKRIVVGGRVLTMGDNQPGAYDTIQIRFFNTSNGKRINHTKVPGPIVTDSLGGFTVLPFKTIPSNTGVEFQVKPREGRSITYYLFRPIRDNYHLYLRTLPLSGMAALLTKGLPKDDVQSALVIYTPNQATIFGRDSLVVENTVLSTLSLMPASKTAISSFVYDDGDRQSSGKVLKQFSGTPFLVGADVFLEAKGKAVTRIYFNKRTITIPRIASSETVQVVIFE